MTAPGTKTSSITVTVTLFADLRRFLPPGVDGPQRYTLAAGACVADLLNTIGITAAYDITIGVDGELATGADVLRNGADVMLLSPMEGGSQGGASGVEDVFGLAAATRRPRLAWAPPSIPSLTGSAPALNAV